MALWLCSYVAMWLCGYVAMWLCGYVAMWLCGYVALWLCGSVAMWLCGYVALFGVWSEGMLVFDSGRRYRCQYTVVVKPVCDIHVGYTL